MSGFYDHDASGQVGNNLLGGYGYNFYRAENQLRQDDQRVRELACTLLSRARAAVDKAESEWRRERIPAPTRAQPFPDAIAVAGAQALERLSRDVGAIEGRVRQQPVPANDRMTERYRREADTLAGLIAADTAAIEEIDQLHQTIEPLAAAAMIEQLPAIEAQLAAIGDRLAARQLLLA